MKYKVFTKLFLVLYDTAAVIAASYLALLVRFDLQFSRIPEEYSSVMVKALWLTVLIAVFVFASLRLYSSLWTYAGATEFFIKRVCYYSVKSPDMFDGKETFGLFYYAEIREFEKELHSEIEKIIITDELPTRWTYPLIQPILLAKLKSKNIR